MHRQPKKSGSFVAIAEIPCFAFRYLDPHDLSERGGRSARGFAEGIRSLIAARLARGFSRYAPGAAVAVSG
jgi:hypothetical protein